MLFLHLDLTDLDDDLVSIGRAERLGPVTSAKILEWVGDSKVRIQPVTRIDGDDAVDGHDPPERMRDQVILRDPTCQFPNCQVDSRRCDLDHVIPYDTDQTPSRRKFTFPRFAPPVNLRLLGWYGAVAAAGSRNHVAGPSGHSS